MLNPIDSFKLGKHKFNHFVDKQIGKLLSKRPLVLKTSRGSQIFNSYSHRKAGTSAFLEKVKAVYDKQLEETIQFNGGSVKNKAVSTGEEARAMLKLSQDYSILANLYSKISFVSTGIDKKANALLKHGWKIVDKNGNENKDLTRLIQKKFKLDSLIATASKQYDLYGTVFYLKLQNRDLEKKELVGTPMFKLPAASEIFLFKIDERTLEISEFTWNSAELFSLRHQPKFDEYGDQNFHVGKNNDPESMFFGSPRLRSLLDLLDVKFLDDENYKSFLSNASMPGIIALTSEATSDHTIKQLNSAFDSLRDKEYRHRAQTIQAFDGVDDNGNPVKTIELITMEPRIGERLTLDEKIEIGGQVYDALGIPRKIMGLQTSGIGGNEYHFALQDYVDNCLLPHSKLIATDMNEFVLPAILNHLEDVGYFERNQYEYSLNTDPENRKIVADKNHFHFEFNRFTSLPDSVRVEKGGELVQGGQITVDYYLTEFLSVQADHLPNEAAARFVPNNVSIIAKDKMVDIYGNSIAKQQDADVDNKEDREDFKDAVDVDSKEKEVNTDITVNDVVKNKSIWGKVKSSKSKKKASNFFSTSKNFKQGLSVIPDLLETGETKELVKFFADLLKKQAEKVKFEVLREKYLNTQGELEKAEFEAIKDQILQEVKKIMPKLIDLLTEKEIDELSVALTYFGKLGYDYGLLQTPGDVKEMTPEQRVEVQDEISNWLGERVNNLLQGEPEAEEKKSFKLNPYFDGDLDTTSANRITDAIVNNTSDLEFQNQIEERAQLITEEEAGKSFSAGLLAYALVMRAKFKKFLPTTAKNPRTGAHGAQVGVVVPIDANFPDGTFWSQELINCQHGVEVLWKNINE